MNNFNSTLIGEAPEFKALLRSAQIASVTDVTLMLLGESGTGKEVLARAIHQESPRRNGPFVAINCAALPESLAESELFGHRKGAFTGAVNDNTGLIRSADGGTLFLDEIAELPASIQAKLLRFLESGECLSVGDTTVRHADVRLITATHVDLYERVQQGLFREDLYFRLNVVPLEIPPLRQRTGDIPLLLNEFTHCLGKKYELESPEFTRATMDMLEKYQWPGNIRELRNFCERMLVLFAGRKIEPGNLPQEMRAQPQGKKGSSIFTLPDEGIVWDDLEQEVINQALDKASGNRSKAARLLGISRDTLLYRIKKYALG